METALKTNDWNEAWQAARQGSSFSGEKKAFWNKRAASFASHANYKSGYPAQFLDIICPKPDWQVLDIGCGPGTIAIPMSEKVKGITAMDFSDGMLEILEQECAEKNIENITPVQAAWEDTWEDFGLLPHDVVIASRSLVADDLKAAILKMNRFSKKFVFVTSPVGTGPFDQRIMEAAGRSFQPGPDYIFLVNQLHAMGIYARVDFTVHPVNRTFSGLQDAVDECRWMVSDMTLEEEEKLREFFENHLVYKKDRWVLPGSPPVRWAVVSWDVRDISA